MSRRIATVLVRSGSKQLADKNVRPFLGQSLLVRTVEQALASNIFDTIAVSSDSDAYLDIARAAGAPILVKRPKELADDTVTKLPGILHAVEYAEEKLSLSFDVVADLAVTSPLRAVDDIVSAVRLLEESGAPLVLSACRSKDNPYFNMLEHSLLQGYELSKSLPEAVSARQHAPKVFSLNGAVYVWRRSEIGRADGRVVRPGAELYLMPLSRSIDVDDEFEFGLAELLATRTCEGQGDA